MIGFFCVCAIDSKPLRKIEARSQGRENEKNDDKCMLFYVICAFNVNTWHQFRSVLKIHKYEFARVKGLNNGLH